MKKLTPEEENVIVYKGTEAPFTGQYNEYKETGTYVCKRCEAPLYSSSDKFESGCGWPSFDEEIKDAIKRVPDADGRRTEIVCANCGAHLGHVFNGEGFTPKNVRHCVNSISLTFMQTDTALFAGGCFWGVESLMEKLDGVLSVTSGYTGGTLKNPTYEQISRGNTGHYEAVEIVFNPSIITYETLAKYFFEIHDPEQANGQGPDIGMQYLSVVFYRTPMQKETVEDLLRILKEKGYKVVTKVIPASTFWKAEDYHQDYYQKKGTQPYCHSYKKRF